MRQIDTSSMICGEASKSLDFVPPIIFVKKLSSQVFACLFSFLEKGVSIFWYRAAKYSEFKVLFEKGIVILIFSRS